jgi:hypothetical protein
MTHEVEEDWKSWIFLVIKRYVETARQKQIF